MIILRSKANTRTIREAAFMCGPKGGDDMATRKMTRSEAGKRGGQTTMKKYGSEFYQKIGKMGGKKGGNTTKERYGIEFYQNIGRKGGLK